MKTLLAIVRNTAMVVIDRLRNRLVLTLRRIAGNRHPQLCRREAQNKRVMHQLEVRFVY